MIRPLTCACVLLAGAAGLYLYQSKHRVQLLDREIENTVRMTQAARERTGVLRAEWTLLNDPERLAQLAGRFLSLKTVTPGQFTTFAELDNRLPAIRMPDPKAPDEAPEEFPSEPIAQAPESSPKTQTAAAPAAKPAPERVAEKPAAEKQPAVKTAAVAQRPERPPERKPAREAPAILAAASSSLPATRVVTHSAIAPAVAAALPRPVPVATASYVPSLASNQASLPRIARASPGQAPAPAFGSALGMARSALAPPVPVSTSMAAYNPAVLNGN